MSYSLDGINGGSSKWMLARKRTEIQRGFPQASGWSGSANIAFWAGRMFIRSKLRKGVCKGLYRER